MIKSSEIAYRQRMLLGAFLDEDLSGMLVVLQSLIGRSSWMSRNG